MPPILTCSFCKTPLRPENHPGPLFVPCPECRRGIRVALFPAYVRPPEVAQAAVAMPQEATCFFHATKAASVPCDGCGRFLCSLCDVEISGRHYCPSCLEGGRRAESMQPLVMRHVRYDVIAMSMAFVPLLILPLWFLTSVSAPAALFLAIRYGRKPQSLVHGSRARFVVAGICAALQIIGWVVLVVYLIARWIR